MRFYLSTIAPDGAALAREQGLGLELAHFCTASNMDRDLPQTHRQVEQDLAGISDVILHGPFNELFPCAIDPLARDLAARRYRQAIDLARRHGAKKLVLHGGYDPWLYYPVWYREQSVVFWKEFLRQAPADMEIVLENVLEEDPQLLPDILSQVDDPRLGMCLDTGHANAYSKVPVLDWLTVCAPFIRHFHVHNNPGSRDAHSALFDGTIPMEALLHRAAALCPEATVTLEVMEAAPSLTWLREKSLLDI